jgi:protein SCO1
MMLALLLSLTTSANAYQLETRFRAEDGKQVTLSRYKGTPVILSFVYTSCGATCPMTTKTLQRIERVIGNKTARFVVVSLNPAQDTPDAVEKYRERYGLSSRFDVLVGADAELRKLTMLLDFRFSKNPESGAIMHDNKIYLLSEKGEVIVMTPSLEEDQDKLISALRS